MLVTSVRRAEYLSEIYVSLPGRNPAAGQPADAELSACGQEAKGKPEKPLIKISTRMQKHSTHLF